MQKKSLFVFAPQSHRSEILQLVLIRQTIALLSLQTTAKLIILPISLFLYMFEFSTHVVNKVFACK